MCVVINFLAKLKIAQLANFHLLSRPRIEMSDISADISAKYRNLT